MNFHSTDMRTTQYPPPKDELHERALEVWNCFKATADYKDVSLFKNFADAEKYVVDTLLVDILRDRFSDPPGWPMYFKRWIDGKFVSSRETCKQESMHRYYRSMYPASRYGNQLHVMLTGRFHTKWNMQQGWKNFKWCKWEHSDVVLALTLNTYDRRCYVEMRRTLYNHIESPPPLLCNLNTPT